MVADASCAVALGVVVLLVRSPSASVQCSPTLETELYIIILMMVG